MVCIGDVIEVTVQTTIDRHCNVCVGDTFVVQEVDRDGWVTVHSDGEYLLMKSQYKIVKEMEVHGKIR